MNTTMIDSEIRLAIGAAQKHENRVFAIRFDAGSFAALAFAELDPALARRCIAIVYPDGGVDYTNDYMRDRIVADVEAVIRDGRLETTV